MKNFDHQTFRAQFPAIKSSLTYLDSASTSLKPQQMIDAINQYYGTDTTTILRSHYEQALTNTDIFDETREKTARLINSKSSDEIIWTQGATASINLIAYSYAYQQLNHESEIIVSELEHHSNLIPWRHVAKKTGAKIVIWSCESDGSLSIEYLQTLVNHRTSIIAVTQMSNVSGYQPDIQKIAKIAHDNHAVIVVDGAQGAVHTPLDVTKTEVDFYVFSCHKLYGPTGIGVLYGKRELLEQMEIWQGGGKMVETVSFDDYQPALIPHKFEAGTPHIAGVIGFNATLSFLENIDRKQAESYTSELVEYTKNKINHLKNINILSVSDCSLLTFTVNHIHHNDLMILLTEQNIAVRSGELCASPLIRKLANTGVVRASFMPYNNQQDADKFVSALEETLTILE